MICFFPSAHLKWLLRTLRTFPITVWTSSSYWKRSTSTASNVRLVIDTLDILLHFIFAITREWMNSFRSAIISCSQKVSSIISLAFFMMNENYFSLVIDSIVWAFKHTMRGNAIFCLIIFFHCFALFHVPCLCEKCSIFHYLNRRALTAMLFL